MTDISAIVITKNEEEIIADCLDSLSFCNEIVVVDSDSDDRTSEISKRMGAKVFKSKSDDFSELRNFGLSKAAGDWILYVDADERVTSELASNIKSQISKNGRIKVSAYKLNRKNFYFGSSKKNEWPYVEKLERLFKKEKLKGWRGKLHETPIIEGEVGEIEGFLLHYTHQNLASMLEKTIKWSKIEAELRFNSNHPKMAWWRIPRVMLSSFLNSYVKQKGWKAGTVGIIESIYQAFSTFITYAKLWELQFKNEK